MTVRKTLIATLQVSATAQPLLGDIRIDPTVTGFYVGVAVTGVSLIGSGGAGGPYAFSVLSGSMPGGLSLAPGGPITGTPTTQGRFEILAQVQDSSLAVYPFRVIFVVKAQLFPIYDTPTPAVRNLAYRYQVLYADATGSTSGITYTIVAGALPTGLSLSTAGVISGTTSVSAGTFTFTVRGTKSGSTLDVPMTLVLRNALSALTGAFTIDPALQNMAIGVPVDASITFASSSGDLGFPPYSWDISAGALPAGLSMDAKGRITGTPTAATPNTYAQPTFRITDKAGQTRTITPSSPKLSVNSTLAAAVRGHFLRADTLGLPVDFDFIALLFGDGHDGDFVLDGTNVYPTVFAKSLGTYTPLRPVYANNLTISGTAVLNAQAPIYVADTFDITNAGAGSITILGGADGGNASGATGGTAGAGLGALLYLGEGGTGTQGATSVNSAVPATPATPAAMPGGIDTNGASSGGNGGSGTSGSGGTGGQGQPAGAFDPPLTPFRGLVNGFGQRVQGGAAGGAGGAGRGNGSAPGGGGGGPGGGAGVIDIHARRVNRGASTAAGAILLKAGKGGNGANASNTNTGGGGAGCGGNSGLFLLTFGELLGTTATNCIKLQGGDAGTPGTGNGTGTAGGTAKGGQSGRAILMDVLTPSVSISAIVTTATASGAIAQVSL